MLRLLCTEKHILRQYRTICHNMTRQRNLGGLGFSPMTSNMQKTKFFIRYFTSTAQLHSDLINAHQKKFITDVPFDSLEIIPESKRAIKEIMNYKFMTDVQTQTMPTILEGTDVLAQAKTGTGKTLAFLIPSVEVLQR